MPQEQSNPPAPRRPASSNTRPQSRASTTSAHSATTQPNVEPPNDFSNMPGMYTQGWSQISQMQPGQPSYPGQPGQSGQPGHSSQDEVVLLQHVANQEAGTSHFQINNMNNHPVASQFASHQIPQSQHQMQTQQQMQAQMEAHQQMQQQMHAQQQLQTQQHQMYHSQNWNDNNHDNETSIDHTAASITANGAHDTGATKSKTSKRRSNANNDGEMRDLFHTNRKRKLHNVAEDLRGNERGPNAERKRQLYAMLWLDSCCVESRSSIPRSRVYHSYASQCTNDKVMVLNPASFGKLVRVVFPSIKTRRLGVRGESKYHYCNFQLRDPPPPEMDAIRAVPAPDAVTQAQEYDFNTPPTQPKDDMGGGRLPSPEDAPNPQFPHIPPGINRGPRSHSRYISPQANTKGALACSISKAPVNLRFTTEAETTHDVNDPLVLPPIDPFLPPQTDKDAADSLAALYRAQCTSIVESFRFLRDKSFFHLYTSFHGTLTMPVQKLFAHPSMAPWIEQCDIILYHRLTKFAFSLSIKVLPKHILNRMRSMSERLVPHILESFHGQPQHVIQAKVVPAAIFSGILERMTRVNMTAHAAARPMAMEANRDQMYVDWVEHINPRRIAESVPSRGMDDVAELLTREMSRLVAPKHVNLDGQDMAFAGLQNAGPNEPTESTVDRLRSFLMSLPDRFPYASHADIVWCVERVGTAITRELTLKGCTSFSTWWAAKTFLDEDVWFLAEVGGFLQIKKLREEPVGPPRAASVVAEDGQKDTAMDNADVDVEMGATSGEPMSVSASPGQSDRAPFPPKRIQPADAAGDANEDSGIGIQTPETEFPMEKFAFTEGENAELNY